MVSLIHAISEPKLKLIANEKQTENAISLIWKWNTLWKDQVWFPLREKLVFSSSGSRTGIQMVPDFTDSEPITRDTVRKIRGTTEPKI